MQSKTRAVRSQSKTSGLRDEDAVQRASRCTGQAATQAIETAKSVHRKQKEPREAVRQREQRSAWALGLARI